MVEYLTVDDILEIHKDVTGRAGRWPTPLQDERGLAKVLLRIRTVETEPGVDVAMQAALLAVGMAQTRPFGGSNLETAVGAMGAFWDSMDFGCDQGVFLRLDGYSVYSQRNTSMTSRLNATCLDFGHSW